MKYGRSGLVLLATVAPLLAASPVFAFMGTCVAQDSDGRSYVSNQPGALETQAMNFAQSVAMSDCQARSQHPQSCRIVSCRVRE